MRKLGPKTRKYLATRNLPGGALVREALAAIEETAGARGKSAANEYIASVEADLRKQLKDAYMRIGEALDLLLPDLAEKFVEMAQKKIDSLPHLKGYDGYTPIKGKDYFDGSKGDPGYTPIPDKDYVSIGTTKQMIDDATAALFEKIEKEGLSQKAIRTMIEEVAKEILDPAKIARGIEALPLIKKLDYHTGLKNQPDLSEKGTQHTIHRGGSSKQTYYYDLSDQCDGNTRIFTIPSNVRVVAVIGTDSPAGTYRPVVDWTGSGTTTLTLTSEVAAPAQGATLYILYVV